MNFRETLRRDFGAAFVAAAFQHNLAGFGRHARAKTVHFGAFGFLGLIGSFWHANNIA